MLFNRPGVAGAVLQTPLLLTDQVNHSSFVKLSLMHSHTQTVIGRERKYLENVHLPQPVMCHVSHDTCNVSRVTCQM